MRTWGHGGGGPLSAECPLPNLPPASGALPSAALPARRCAPLSLAPGRGPGGGARGELATPPRAAAPTLSFDEPVGLSLVCSRQTSQRP